MEIAFLNDILFLYFFYSFLDIFNDQSLHTFIITINVCAMKCEKNGFFQFGFISCPHRQLLDALPCRDRFFIRYIIEILINYFIDLIFSVPFGIAGNQY